jgi:hypothetical protein
MLGNVCEAYSSCSCKCYEYIWYVREVYSLCECRVRVWVEVIWEGEGVE